MAETMDTCKRSSLTVIIFTSVVFLNSHKSVTASPDLLLSLQPLLQTRMPPYSKEERGHLCRTLILCKHEASVIMVNCLKEYFQTKEILSGQDARVNSSQSFKFSRPCLHILVDITTASEIPPNRYWINGFVGNMKAAFVHFVLVGLKAELGPFIATEAYDMLQYKTALSLDTGDVIVGDSGLYSSVTTIPTLPSEAQIMNGRKMKVLLWKYEPYVSFDLRGNAVGGFTYRHAKEFCHRFNTTCLQTIRFDPAHRLPNGTWRGYMYSLTEGDGDVIFALGITKPRYTFVDYTVSTLSFEGRFITSHPRSTVKWSALVYAFDLTVWTMIVAVLVALLPLYLLHFWVDGYAQKAFINTADAAYIAVATPFALLVQQGTSIPRQAKLLTLFVIFYSLLIGNYYNSNLISFLTFPEKDILPTTIEELAAARHDYEIAIAHVNGTVFSAHIGDSSNPDIVKIREVLIWETDMDSCVRRAIIEYTYVCLAMVGTYKMLAIQNFTIHSQFKPYVESSDLAMNAPMAVGTAWNSRYYASLNRFTAQLSDTGHLAKWWNDGMNYVHIKSQPWIKEQVSTNSQLVQNLTRATNEAEISSLKPFTVTNVVLCFGFLVVGLTLSFVSWVIEMALQIRKERCLSEVTSSQRVSSSSSLELVSLNNDVLANS